MHDHYWWGAENEQWTAESTHCVCSCCSELHILQGRDISYGMYRQKNVNPVPCYICDRGVTWAAHKPWRIGSFGKTAPEQILMNVPYLTRRSMMSFKQSIISVFCLKKDNCCLSITQVVLWIKCLPGCYIPFNTKTMTNCWLSGNRQSILIGLEEWRLARDSLSLSLSGNKPSWLNLW